MRVFKNKVIFKKVVSKGGVRRVVANAKDRFSHNKAHYIQALQTE